MVNAWTDEQEQNYVESLKGKLGLTMWESPPLREYINSHPKYTTEEKALILQSEDMIYCGLYKDIFGIVLGDKNAS